MSPPAKSAAPEENGNGTLRSLLLQVLNEAGIIQQQTNAILDEHGRASASRLELHNKVGQLVTEVALLQQTVNRIAPMVDAHERAQQRSSGERTQRALSSKTVWALVTIAAGVFAYVADMLTRLWMGGKH